MDQSMSAHTDRKNTFRPNQQGNLLQNQEEISEPIKKKRQNHAQHVLDPPQSVAAQLNLPAPLLSSSSRVPNLVRVDRSEILNPPKSSPAAFTEDNLCQLQILLANPMPMARWESESVKMAVWNNLGEVVAGQDGGSPLPGGRRGTKNIRPASEQGREDMR
jgi:hypothetical protein